MKNTLPIALQLALFLSIFAADITKTVRTITNYEKNSKVFSYKLTDSFQSEIEHGRKLKSSIWNTVDSSRLASTRKIKRRA